MREYADAMGLIYMNKNPTAAPNDVLKHVEGKVKKQFSDKFVARKAAPNAVRVVLPPVQIATSPLVVTVGEALIITGTVVSAEIQLPTLTVSVIFFVPGVAQFT